MKYKFDEATGNYYLMNNGKIVMATKEVALCYSIPDDGNPDSSDSTLLNHGSPERVKHYLEYMQGMYQDAFPDEIEELRCFQGIIPVDDLNKIVSNEISIADYHKKHLMAMN